MNFKSQKGFTLIELLVSLLIMAMIGTLVTSLFVFGSENFKVYSNYTKQQNQITEATQKLRKDIEEASKIVIFTETDNVTMKTGFVRLNYPGSTKYKVWKFEDNQLKVGSAVGSAQPTLDTAIENVFTDKCKFDYAGGTNDWLTAAIQPVPNNTGKYDGKNIKKPIITEFSVKYKSVEKQIFTGSY